MNVWKAQEKVEVTETKIMSAFGLIIKHVAMTSQAAVHYYTKYNQNTIPQQCTALPLHPWQLC